jgi:hypothetical protein
MLYKRFILLIACAALLCIGTRSAWAQSPDTDEHKFEVGAQFTVLNVSRVEATSARIVACLVPPCPEEVTIERSREAEPGFGGRIGYNVNSFFAVEAELNYFPRERRFDGGQDVELLAGVKVGRRFEKIGVFAKARPGFLSSRISDFIQPPTRACIAVAPPPAACFDEIKRRETSFAFDVGGVLEFYPTRRTIIRLDAGDTIVRLGARRLIAPSTIFPTGVLVIAPPETTHNFQGSIGVSFRF